MAPELLTRWRGQSLEIGFMPGNALVTDARLMIARSMLFTVGLDEVVFKIISWSGTLTSGYHMGCNR